MTIETNHALIDWLTSGKTGLSSLTIAQVLGGSPAPAEWWRTGRYPHDPSDFGRCLGLLAAVPEFEARLPEVAAVYPVWAPLVREWASLKALYFEELPTGDAPKLYWRMRDLIAEGRAA